MTKAIIVYFVGDDKPSTYVLSDYMSTELDMSHIITNAKKNDGWLIFDDWDGYEVQINMKVLKEIKFKDE